MSDQNHIKNFEIAMMEILAQMDLESAKAFVQVYNKRLEELINDQQTILQKNSGASR